VRFTDIITAGVEPQMCVAVLLAVVLAVVEYALEHVGNGAVVASTVTGGEDYDIAVARITRVAVPASVVWHLPIPFWLRLEVARLRLVILHYRRHYCLSGRVIPVGIDWYVAEEFEENDQCCDY
jgi:hypothetical protein